MRDLAQPGAQASAMRAGSREPADPQVPATEPPAAVAEQVERADSHEPAGPLVPVTEPPAAVAEQVELESIESMEKGEAQAGEVQAKTAEPSAAASGAGAARTEEQAEARTCAVCLTSEVSTLALPCRHAVLCEECMGGVRATSGRCPICRTHIAATMKGTFPSEFVDLAPGMMAAVGRPLALAQRAVYERMYDHIRMLLVLGLAAAVASTTCLLAPPAPLLAPGIALASLAVCAGYLPWLAVSIYAFENGSASGGSSVHSRLFSSEDLRRPCALAIKCIVLLIGTPVALAVFFIPYVLYAGILRPFASKVVPFCLRMMLRGFISLSCFSYTYVLRPLGLVVWYSGLGVAYVMWKVYQGGRWCCQKIAYALEKVCEGACWCCEMTGRGLTCAAKATSSACYSGANCCLTRVVAPSGRCLCRSADCCLTRVVAPSGRCLCRSGKHTGGFVHRRILQPVWHGLTCVATGSHRGAVASARAVHGYVLAPCGRGVAWSVRAFGACCVAIARMVYDYLLVPLGRGFMWSLRMLGRCLAASARLLHDYALSPCGRGVVWSLRKAGSCCVASARVLRDYLLLPCGHGFMWSLRTLGWCCAASAKMLYLYLLAPCGRCCAAACRALREYLLSPCGRGIGRAAALFLERVIKPTCRTLWRCLKAICWAIGACLVGSCLCARASVKMLAGGLAKAAGALFLYVLAPVGRAIAFVASRAARGVAAASRALYAHVLAPIGSALAACCGALRRSAAAVGAALAGALAACAAALRDWVMSPLAILLARLGRTAADAARATAARLRDLGAWFVGVARQAQAAARDAVQGIFRAFAGGTAAA